MNSIGLAISVSVLTSIVFIFCALFAIWFYDDGEDVEYEKLKKTVAELKREIKRISDLSDRIWNAEIDLKNHKKDCKMTGIKLEVVELLENRVAILEREMSRK